MKILGVIVLGCLLEVCRGVCVLEVGVDNLGMVVNCRLKKSSIVRVRNLGGVKGYIDVGLSLGDEMGFKPTFAATEDRRRSPQGRRDLNQLNKGGKKSLVPASIPASKTPYKWLNASRQPKNGSAAAPQAFRKALQSASNHFLDSPQGATTKEGSLAHPFSLRLAPRDYYPPGYPDIPHDLVRPAMQLNSPTSSFLCREQKYFPGIYADTTLGCTVFHACASVNDKMVDKSYSCPEFTLFDQSVLMCNWWFYVDCKASGKLYDSNVPLSKSFRLMKALSFTLENET